ncbi:DUF3795 domain-containing protein [Bacillota bacterium LX-D]|nr:DUF3795 domain-containing protein [Bacillota bacterium LX-D]
MINKCGLCCNECYAFQKECPGCEEVCGKPFWTEYIGGEPCPVYKCCEEKAFQNCGKCNELPCKKWYDLKDPSLSDEEHLNSINKRVSLLSEGE